MTRILLVFLFICVISVAGFSQSESAQPSVPVQVRDLLLKSKSHFDAGRFDEALAPLVKAADLHPGNAAIYAMMASIYIRQNKLEQASEHFSKAISYNPNNKTFHFYKANVDMYRNKPEEGLISIKKAIELDPNYAEAYLLLARLSGNDEENRPEKIAALRKVIELRPDLYDSYAQLGMLLKVSGDKNGAESVYKLALERDPKKAVFFDLGRLLVDQGRLTEARALWNERPPTEERTFPNFITLLERAEKHEAARTFLEKNPNDADANLRMGLAIMDGDHWVVDGRQKRAILFFQKALELKPGFAKAQHAICMAYVQIADTYKNENPKVDEELSKLKALDTKLADEIVEYRRTYSGGLKMMAPPPPSPKSKP